MKVVVTGATGNVGTAVVRRLLEDGDADVVGVARRVPDRPSDPGMSWLSLDLSTDACEVALREAVTGADAVVHLAWGFQPSHDEGQLEQLGVGGTRRVLGAAAGAGVPHLVHMSSVGAYSPKVDDEPVDEDYPTEGIGSSMYSRHKAAAERLLDRFEDTADASRPTLVTRVRPGIVGQRAAGSALARYGLPGLLPGRLVGLLPVVPLDRRLRIPMVHADDLADAVVRIIGERASGAFNVAAEPVLTPADIGAALGARPVYLPGRVLRTAVDLSWRARVQPLDAGWIDLAMQVPLMDTARARRLLGWTPSHSAEAVLHETVAGLRDSASGATAVLRPRTVLGNLRDRFARGAVTRRQEP